MPNDIRPLIFILGDMVRPDPGHRLIFSYDFMMDDLECRKRWPTARFVTIARLFNRRWIVNSQGIITVIPCRNSVVYGVVWGISQGEQATFEAELGFPNRVDRHGAFARDRREQLVAVEYYAAKNHRLGEAEPIEIVRLMALANRRRFPESYRDEIASFAPGPVEPNNRPRLVE